MYPNLTQDDVVAYVRLSRDDLKALNCFECEFAKRREQCVKLACATDLSLLPDNIFCESVSGTRVAIRPYCSSLLERARKGTLTIEAGS